MKIKLVILTLLALASRALPAPLDLAQSDFAATQRGSHHTVWSRSVEERTPDGRVVNRTHSYTELASGLNYWSEEQKSWLPSTEEVEIVNGSAVARHGAMSIVWAANPNVAGAVDVQQTSDGKRFRSHILGIAFTDAKTGASAFIANLQDCIGQVTGNTVTYPNAFDSIAADIIYVYSRCGLEQNVLLKQALPDPSKAPFNMDPSTVRVEVYTEFIEYPEASLSTTMAKQETDPGKRPFMVEPDLTDSQLDFGTSLIGRGTAFLTGMPNDAEAVPVYKTFETRDGNRRVLVERVEYTAIQNQLAALPRAARMTKEQMAKVEGGAVRDKKGIPKLLLPTPPGKAAKLKTEPMKMAQLTEKPRGLILDYNQVNTMTNALLRADQTYYISGPITLTTPTFEGGVVIKYAPTNTAKIQLKGLTTFLTSPYRMVYLTARDDHSIGEQIGTNALSGYYASIALDLDGSSVTFTLPYLRVSYASCGIQFFGGSGRHVLKHSQIVKCDKAFVFYNSDTAFRNVLVTLVNTFDTASGATASRWEHVTLDQIQDFNSLANATFYITNSLLVAVTNAGSYYGANNSAASNSSSVFQTMGGGSHYLVAGSSYRNAGTTNIDATLAAELKTKTTYAPNQLTNLVATNTTISLVAQRDTDTPDQGWHADAIDWAMASVIISNATLNVQPGTALAGYGSGTGLILGNAATLTAEGSPTNLIRLVRYNTVQEQAVTNWSSPSPGNLLAGTGSTITNYPTSRFRFTDWTVPCGGLLFQGSGASPFTNYFKDSQFHGGSFQSLNASVFLTNCLFERVAVSMTETVAFNFIAYNNTFYGGSFYNDHVESGTWKLRNNLFDKTVITSFENTDNAYSGYITNSSRLTPTSATDVVQTTSTNIAFQTGWLGAYYLATNSVFINKGSTNADLLSLYHFTTQTNQIKETNSVVDIGFHYVAVDTNGIPFDADFDGVPDAIEDANGNGAVDPGEMSFLNSDTDGDGMPDGWELRNGLNPLANDANSDPDGDGIPNNQDYQPFIFNWVQPIITISKPTNGVTIF